MNFILNLKMREIIKCHQLLRQVSIPFGDPILNFENIMMTKEMPLK